MCFELEKEVFVSFKWSCLGCLNNSGAKLVNIIVKDNGKSVKDECFSIIRAYLGGAGDRI